MKKRPKFAIIGAAGYVARKHVEAIHGIGGVLVAAMDPACNVGYLDSYFPRCAFFRESGGFIDIIDAMGVDYVAVCTPSMTHSWLTIAMLAANKNVICEKPLCLEPDELDLIEAAEKDSTSVVNTILQFSFLPGVIEFYRLCKGSKNLRIKVEHQTPRGDWYHKSWKGGTAYSGGLITNIGIHMLYMLIRTLGEVVDFKLYPSTASTYRADLKFQNNIKVELYLDIHRDIYPKKTIEIINKDNNDYTRFVDLGGVLGQSLHTKAYEQILAGEGIGIKDVRPSIELAYAMRNA